MNRISKLRIVFFLLIACFSVTMSFCQVRTKVFVEGIPSSFFNKKEVIQSIQLPVPSDFAKKKNEANKKLKSGIKLGNEFATSIELNLDLLKIAQRQSQGAITTFSIKLIADDALNLSFEFGKFHLSKNSVLSLYTDRELTDSITANQNNDNDIWATRVYQGKTVSIALSIPSNELSDVALVFSKVNYGYQFFGAQFGNPGSSSSCNVNVNCPAGTGWEKEKNSVALIVANGQLACSGALVMNTCNTNVPYFLTANHCLAAGNVNNWVFQFQYWSATCTPNGGWREDIQFNGCVLRANSAKSDFALLELNQAPSATSGIYYSGWDRNLFPIISQTTILHHPAGDLMKISKDNASPVKAVFANIQCWKLNIVPNAGGDYGTTNDHSSGGPYFSQDHKIFAQHFGIDQTNSDDCLNTNKYGGAFWPSWDGDGTNQTRLKNWLDPSNTGAMTVNTTSIASLPNVNLAISGSASLCTSQQYQINTTLPITWTASPPGYVNFSCTTCVSTIATRANNARGNIVITAAVNSGCAAGRFASKAVAVGSPVAISYTRSTTCSNGYQTWYLNANPSTNGSNWVWTVGNVSSGSVINIYNSNSNAPQVNVKGFGAVRVNYIDQCGTTQQDGITVYSSCPSSLVISPNPASNAATISLEESNTNQNRLGSASLFIKLIYKINVVNKRGSIVKVFNSRTGINSASINLTGLVNGTYTIRAFDGANWSVNQLVVLR